MLNLRTFLQPISICQALIRNTATYGNQHNKNVLYDKKDRVLIEGKIAYYPRYKNEPEPSHEPSKLFKVTRIKPMKGQPHYERRILRDFGLFNNNAVAIVKNIPEVNAMLWKVKHLIKIEAITFPFGEPTLKEVEHTYLRENGECLVIKEIGRDFDKRVKAAKIFHRDTKKLKTSTLTRDSRLAWEQGW